MVFWSFKVAFHLDQLSSFITRAMSLSPSLLAIQDDEMDEDDRASLASSLQSQFGTPLFGLSPSEEVSFVLALFFKHPKSSWAWGPFISALLLRGGLFVFAAKSDCWHCWQHHGIRNWSWRLPWYGDGRRCGDVSHTEFLTCSLILFNN